MFVTVALLIFSSSSFSSGLPCGDFEVLVSPHKVKAYNKQSGVKVSESDRKAHCRLLYPGTENWINSFRDSSLIDWPYKEVFKAWSKLEKEKLLSLIPKWPENFKNYKDIVIHRAVKSQTQGNFGGSLPKANAIVIYDGFFNVPDPFPTLTHELAHIHVLKLDPKSMESMLRQMGWDYDRMHKPKWSGKRLPLKTDSPNSPSEDLANHIEDYLHQPAKLKRDRPDIFIRLEDLLGKDFKLKEKP